MKDEKKRPPTTLMSPRPVRPKVEPDVVRAAKIIAEAIDRLAASTRAIANGDGYGPSGLELLAMAISGRGRIGDQNLREDLASALRERERGDS